MWEEISGWFDPELNGVLPDVHVPGTTIADWRRAIELVRAERWVTEYSIGDAVADLPEQTEALFDRPDDESTLLRVWPVPGLLANFFFHTPTQIDFDVDLRELQGQDRLDALCQFFKTLGRELRKPVVMTPEGIAELRILVYEPTVDRVVLTAKPWGVAR